MASHQKGKQSKVWGTPRTLYCVHPSCYCMSILQARTLMSNIRLFADDCILYQCINESNDSEAHQSDFQRLVDWSASWQMNFNTYKCSVMHITKTYTLHHYQYMINEENLGIVHLYPYLLVELSDELIRNNHLSNLTVKSNCVLGFIGRNLFKCSRETVRLF